MNFIDHIDSPKWVKVLVAIIALPAALLFVAASFGMVSSRVQNIAFAVFSSIVAVQFLAALGHQQGYRDNG